MCGIAGFLVAPGDRPPGDWREVLKKMGGALAHRGPDAAGEWFDPEAGIGFAHRRLSIIDVSDAGSQPMISTSGRFVVSYNGEIYNFRSLRSELEGAGRRFRGDSDTEVLLAAVEQWGLDHALRRFAGMFAFALWDRTDRKLWFARDRIGKKPLHIARCGGALIFGSELTALRAFPGFRPDISRTGLHSYLSHGYVAGSTSILESTVPLPAAHYWGTTAETIGSIAPEQIPERAMAYWDIRSVANAYKDPSLLAPEAAADAVRDVLRGAVAERMISDVPLGAFLSGGIDSSLVVAMMQEQSNSNVKTFSIGFNEREFDESEHAREIAAFLGTDHTELFVTADEALATVTQMGRIFDEPFADPSQIPSYLVSKLARGDVTVAVTGDGGDEVFGGYDIYQRGMAMERYYRLPHALRSMIASPVRGVPEQFWDRGVRALPGAIRGGVSGRKIRAAAEISGLRGGAELKRRDEMRWLPPPMIEAAESAQSGFMDRWNTMTGASDAERMMYTDTTGSLQYDILVKTDRSSMASSLELRSPLLDHRVIELAWRLPVSCKIGDGRGKLVLRSLLSQYMPVELYERPKRGFSVPIAEWLQGPLRDWAEALLDPVRLRQQGLLDAEAIEQVWKEHLAGRPGHEFRLWTVLMLLEWIENLD